MSTNPPQPHPMFACQPAEVVKVVRDWLEEQGIHTTVHNAPLAGVAAGALLLSLGVAVLPPETRPAL